MLQNENFFKKKSNLESWWALIGGGETVRNSCVGAWEMAQCTKVLAGCMSLMS